jgi:histidine ammonia-lyase
VAAAHGAIRAVVPHLEEDRAPAPDIDQVLDMVRSGALLTAGEQAA